jgi:hypothetical protein
MTRPDLHLTNFVQHLHEMNSDPFGCPHKMEQDRCKRWMDAVLPPPPAPSEGNFPGELTKAAKPESEMLPLPYTFPDTGFAYQLLSVVEDHNDDHKMHVELADSMDYAESWGSYLCEVARVIVRDYLEYLETDRADGDLFAAMCDGFVSNMARIALSPETIVRCQRSMDAVLPPVLVKEQAETGQQADTAMAK